MELLILETNDIEGGETGMARRKKNPIANVAAQIAEKQADAERIIAEMDALKEGINLAKAELKQKKNEWRATQKAIARLNAQKEREEQAKAEEDKKDILKAKIKEMVGNGLTYEDILNKLD